MSIDFTSNLSYTCSWTYNIFSNLYKLPCLQDDIFIFVFSCTFHCKSAKVSLIALYPHPSGSIFGSTALNNILLWILGCFIVLLVNVSQGSMIVVNGIMYFTSCSSIMGILNIVYCTFSRMWNYITLSNNYNST